MALIGIRLDVLGYAAVVLMLVATGAAIRSPGRYTITRLDEWANGIVAQPGAALVMSFGFLVALTLFAAWSILVGQRLGANAPWAAIAVLVGLTLINAVGSLAPAMLTAGVPGDASGSRVILSIAMFTDAAYNLGLFVGLVAMGRAMIIAGVGPAALGWLGIVAGVASLPVTLQVVASWAPRIVPVSGLLWSAWVVWTSWTLRFGA